MSTEDLQQLTLAELVAAYRKTLTRWRNISAGAWNPTGLRRTSALRSERAAERLSEQWRAMSDRLCTLGQVELDSLIRQEHAQQRTYQFADMTTQQRRQHLAPVRKQIRNAVHAHTATRVRTGTETS